MRGHLLHWEAYRGHFEVDNSCRQGNYAYHGARNYGYQGSKGKRNDANSMAAMNAAPWYTKLGHALLCKKTILS